MDEVVKGLGESTYSPVVPVGRIRRKFGTLNDKGKKEKQFQFYQPSITPFKQQGFGLIYPGLFFYGEKVAFAQGSGQALVPS